MILEWIDAAAAISLAAFLNGFWIGALLACGAWALVGMLSKRMQVNATTRYIVWASVLVICVGLVLWRGWQESGGISDRVVEKSSGETAQSVEAVQSVRPATRRTATAVGNGARIESPVAKETTRIESPEQEVEPVSEAVESREEAAEASVTAAESSESGEHYRIYGPALSDSWRRALLVVWGIVSGFLLLRVLVSLVAVRRLKRRSRRAPRDIERILESMLARLKSPRNVEVALSDDIETAVAVGFFQPMILLPASMPASLSEDELEQVLVHETAHVQRYDDWSMLAQSIVSALLFFHPGVFLVVRLMNRDREFACDDWVVALTRRPKAYASCLARLVAIRSGRANFACSPAFSSGKKQLFERVETILDRNRTPSYDVSGKAYAAVFGLIVLFLALTLHIAPVVAMPDVAVDPVEIAREKPVESGAQKTNPVAARPDRAEREREFGAADRVSSASIESEAVVPDEPAESVIERAERVDDRKVPEGQPAAKPDRFTIQRMASATPPEAALAELPQARIDASRVRPGRNDSLSKQSMIRLLKSIERIGASGDKAQVLVAAASKLIEDAEVYVAYIDASATVPAPGDRARAMMALLNERRLDAASAVYFLQAVSDIAPPGDKARTLLFTLESEALPMTDSNVADAFIEAMETIEAPGDYKRVAMQLINWQKRD